MGLEEEKIQARNKDKNLPSGSKDKLLPKHLLLFGVPVIIEENSSSNQ